mmetsp:Transcript_39342/g.98505  ORF Transcript_39342/g.98505 Transcript_39342/m.98505 type:complete len:223 (+) Transcript_39342:519-1187(+)
MGFLTPLVLHSAYMAALAVPPAPTRMAVQSCPVRRRREQTFSSTRLRTATQSVLSPTSTLVPSARLRTMMVLTAAMRLAESESSCMCGMTSSLRGIVTLPPPNSSRLITSSAALMSVVSQRSYVHPPMPRSLKAALCMAGEALLAMGDPKRKKVRTAGVRPSSWRRRLTSEEKSWPGAAAPGMRGCVEKVRKLFVTRDCLPAAPMQRPTAGILCLSINFVRA